MGAWKRTGPKRPCPICGHDGWCSISGDGSAVTCQRTHGAEVPGWKILKTPAQTRGGTVYQAAGATGTYAPSAAELEIERREAEEERKKEIARAAALWKAGVGSGGDGGDGPGDHPRAVAYVEARGIPVDQLPGGRLPRAIRCTGDREDYTKDDEGAWGRTSGPVLLAAVADEAGRLQAVQRIFLHESEPRKRSTESKLARGPLKGGAARLYNDLGADGTLILVEGVETGLAVLAALARGGKPPAAVWACISTTGLTGLEIPHELARRGGALRRIIIAGDHDSIDEGYGWRPGEHAAQKAAERFGKLHRHIAVGVVLPSREHAPELVGEDGEILAGGKSVDWLDVYVRCGAERVCEALLGVVAPAEPTRADVAGDEIDVPPELIIDPNNLERSRRALREMYAPPEIGPERGWRMRYWDGVYWRYTGKSYTAQSEPGVRKDLRTWLNRFYFRKLMKDGRRRVVPLNPSEKSITELLTALQGDVLVEAERMPVWLPADFEEDGEPLFGARRAHETSIDPEDLKRLGRVDPMEIIAFEDGLLDVRAFVEGRVVFHEHTELLFTGSCLPYPCPLEALTRVGTDDDALLGEVAAAAPLFIEFLESSSGFASADDRAAATEEELVKLFPGEANQAFRARCSSDGYSVEQATAVEWMDVAAMLGGNLLRAEIFDQVIGALVGLRNSGKSTLLKVYQRLVGKRGYVVSSLNHMTRPFHLHSFVGKLGCFMPDVDVGRTTDVMQARENMLTISAGDPSFIDRKNKDAISEHCLFAKIIVAMNRMFNVPDPSGALGRRLRVLAFAKTFQGRARKEFSSSATMEAEAMGRMLWALRGLRLMHRRGGIQQPVRGAELLARYAEHADPVGMFVHECVDVWPPKEQGEGEKPWWVPCADVFNSWIAWCEERKQNHQNAGWFGTQLIAICPDIRRTQKQERGDRRYVYEGLRLRAEAPVWAPARQPDLPT